MLGVKIESDDRDIHLECPSCGNWEQLGVDDPRKKLNVIPIIEWLEGELNGNETTINECLECNNLLLVEWDYNNPMK